MSQLISIVKLTRPINCLLAVVSVWTGAYMTLSPVALWPVAIASLCAFLVCAAGNVHNDICDLAVDQIAHPERMLPSGQVSIAVAGWLALGFVIVGLILAGSFGTQLLLLVASIAAFLYLYNTQIKRWPFVGNLLVGLIAGGTFLVGGIVNDPEEACLLPGPLIPAVFGVLLHLGRELVKDIADLEGDSPAGIRTVPSLIGVRPTLVIVTILGLALGVAIYVPYAYEWYGVRYWIISIAGVVPLTLGMSLVALIRPSRQMILALSSSLKASMLVGLAALYLA